MLLSNVYLGFASFCFHLLLLVLLLLLLLPLLLLLLLPPLLFVQNCPACLLGPLQSVLNPLRSPQNEPIWFFFPPLGVEMIGKLPSIKWELLGPLAVPWIFFLKVFSTSVWFLSTLSLLSQGVDWLPAWGSRQLNPLTNPSRQPGCCVSPRNAAKNWQILATTKLKLSPRCIIWNRRRAVEKVEMQADQKLWKS